MPEFLRLPLREVLDEKGYIRGPFGSAVVRSELRDFGIPVYEQQHAISGTREFRFFVSDNNRLRLCATERQRRIQQQGFCKAGVVDDHRGKGRCARGGIRQYQVVRIGP